MCLLREAVRRATTRSALPTTPSTTGHDTPCTVLVLLNAVVVAPQTSLSPRCHDVTGEVQVGGVNKEMAFFFILCGGATCITAFVTIVHSNHSLSFVSICPWSWTWIHTWLWSSPGSRIDGAVCDGAIPRVKPEMLRHKTLTVWQRLQKGHDTRDNQGKIYGT